MDQGAISSEEVVIACFLEGWLRRRERLGRGRAGLGRAQLRKAYKLAERGRVGSSCYQVPRWWAVTSSSSEKEIIPAREERHLL